VLREENRDEVIDEVYQEKREKMKMRCIKKRR